MKRNFDSTTFYFAVLPIAVVFGAAGLMSYLKSRSDKKLVTAPPAMPVEPPQPRTPTQPHAPPEKPVSQSTVFEFEDGAEEFLTLSKGAEFSITWDKLSPWRYGIEDTDVLEAVEIGDGFARFQVKLQMVDGAFDQVYVLALGETDDEVVGTHKVTVFGP